MRKKIIVLILTVGASLGFLIAQDRTFTGKVIAVSDGAPLPGVNVILKGTTMGATTDAKGKITEWIKCGYNARGERMFELKLDADGKTITKSIYTYNNKGLKAVKKTYDSTDKLISHKKYSYSY